MTYSVDLGTEMIVVNETDFELRANDQGSGQALLHLPANQYEGRQNPQVDGMKNVLIIVSCGIIGAY